MERVLKSQAILIGGLMGFAIPTYYAWMLYTTNVKQNVATWMMVFVLDLLGLVLAWRGGNKKPYLQIGWAMAAFLIFVVVATSDQPSVWRWTEYSSTALVVVAIVLWITLDALRAQWAYMTAMWISFVPLMKDYWSEPQPGTLWLWLLTIVSCLFVVLGAEKRDFANIFVAVGAGLLNVVITAIILIR
ncbi:MAG: hypothetical protein PHV99_00375 [Candidatus Pacebacteria bacterium]|nr:hypothetical protein [Candidatus Paceibacterota bacterium]